MFSDLLINKLKKATTVAALTGAGISAESGVPTFRGEQGLWKKFRPEELANFNAFMKNPKLVWEWYNFRKNLISQVQPNPGHHALVQMETYFQDFYLITQNVDNLHRLAGNKRIYELHGNIMRNRCVDCNKQWSDTLIDEENLPHCDCGGLIRPDVVWFGESLPEKEITKSFEVARKSEVFFSIGTSALVQPAASLPIEAKRAGAYVVEINFEPTVITDYVDESIIGKSGEILPSLIRQIINDQE
ncbi:NAD-dependent deacylase [candidate division KSB1 bacterium]|nr:NAD-dependent deacylase [candidate division KSB1 bacterium]MBL7093407.1 NAD-dependent deacylase [candidate division KSB1 bacterium]